MLLIVMMMLATVPFVPGLQVYLAKGQLNEYLSFSLVLTLSGILAFGILFVFVLIAVFPATTEQLARRVLEALHVPNVDRWLKPVQSIVEGLSALRSAKDGLAIGAWSIALWLVSTMYFGTTMWACRDFIPGPSPLKSLVALWASALGMIFPATGGIGSFHFAVRELRLRCPRAHPTLSDRYRPGSLGAPHVGNVPTQPDQPGTGHRRVSA